MSDSYDDDPEPWQVCSDCGDDVDIDPEFDEFLCSVCRRKAYGTPEDDMNERDDDAEDE